MQGAKTFYGMREQSHSVWCKCQRGDGGAHHNYPTEAVETYEEVCGYCKEIGCETKTHDEICGWAHFSPGVAKGGKFTPINCTCCGYNPTEKQWLADLAKWHSMSDEEQADARKLYADQGDELKDHMSHYHQELYMPPVPDHGMERCGVDQLHLVYLNVFKHLFKYTIHEPLPESKKKLVSQYIAAAGFYSYDAADESDDPVKRWIGREVKRFLHEADQHIPFLLNLSSRRIDESRQRRQRTQFRR